MLPILILAYQQLQFSMETIEGESYLRINWPQASHDHWLYPYDIHIINASSVIGHTILIFYWETFHIYELTWEIWLTMVLRVMFMYKVGVIVTFAIYVFERIFPQAEQDLLHWFLEKLKWLMGADTASQLVVCVCRELWTIGLKLAMVVIISLFIPFSMFEQVLIYALLECSVSDSGVWKSKIVYAITYPFGCFFFNMTLRVAWVHLANVARCSMLGTAITMVTIELFLYSFTLSCIPYCKFEHICFSILSIVLCGVLKMIGKVLKLFLTCESLKTFETLKQDWKTFVKYIEKEDVCNVIRCLEKINPGFFTNKNVLWFLIWFMTDLESVYPGHAMIRLLKILERPFQIYEGIDEVKYVNSLHIAAVCGNVKKVQFILNKLERFDVNLKGTLKKVDSNAQTPLMMACGSELKERDEIIKLLLAHPKIDVNTKTEAGLTALKITFKNVLAGKCMESFKLLLGDRKLNVNIKLDGNRTPLMMAIDHLKDEEQREIVLELILKHPKLEVNLLGNPARNYTALHHAVEEDQPRTVKALLKVPKIRVNAKTSSNETPLILATSRDNPHCLEIVKLLVALQNIDINAVDSDSYTAIHRALDNQNSKVVQLLDNNKPIDEYQPTRPGQKTIEVKQEDVQMHETKKSEGRESVKCCWYCGEEDVKLFKCGGCKKAFYCGDKCIQKDWEVHERWCSKMKEKREKKKICQIR